MSEQKIEQSAAPEINIFLPERDGVNSFTNLRLEAFKAENPGLPGSQEMRQKNTRHIHETWEKGALPSWEATQNNLIQQSSVASSALGSAGFSPGETKELNTFIKKLTKDPRVTKKGEQHMRDLFSELLPLQNELITLEKLKGSPAHTNTPEKRAALAAIDLLAKTRMNGLRIPVIAQNWMTDRHKALSTESAMDRVGKGAASAVGAIAVLMTLVTGIASLRGKSSIKPAAFYALVAFASLGGIGMLTKTPTDLQIEQLAFLGEEGFLKLQKKYEMDKMKGWGDVANAIRTQPKELKNFQEKLRKKEPITKEDEKAVFTALNAPVEIQENLRTMIRNHSDFSAFVRDITSVENKYSQDALYGYLESGANPASVREFSRKELEADMIVDPAAFAP